MLKFPIAADVFSHQRARQLEPDETFRRRTASAPGMFIRAEFNLPAVTGNLRRRQWERIFGKLDKKTSIGVGSQQQVTDEFGAVFRRFPNRLALLDAPAGRGKIGGWQIVCRSAGNAKNQREQK